MVEAFKRYFNVDKKEAKTVGDAPRKAQGVAKADDDAPIIRLVAADLRGRAPRSARPTSTSSRWRTACASASASTACCNDRRRLSEAPAGRRSPRASRSWPRWTSRRSASRRTAASSSRRSARTSTCASRRCPATHGESIVMRLLDKSTSGSSSLERLGFGRRRPASASARIIKRPNGIVLVTGPTGSGKTTTLYAALQELNRPDVKIITAENPVEYHLAGINQCQVQPPDRARLRADPARDAAAGAEHHPGRRDPRQGDGRDRDPGGADGPPRVLDAPHERRAVGAHAPHRHGRASRSSCRPRCCAVMAQRLDAAALPACKAERAARRRGCSRAPASTEAADRGPDALPREGLRRVQRLRATAAAFGIYEVFEMSARAARSDVPAASRTYRLRELAADDRRHDDPARGRRAQGARRVRPRSRKLARASLSKESRRRSRRALTT